MYYVTTYTIQTLTEGTKVTLTYELNRYTLKVLKCEPSTGEFERLLLSVDKFYGKGNLSVLHWEAVLNTLNYSGNLMNQATSWIRTPLDRTPIKSGPPLES